MRNDTITAKEKALYGVLVAAGLACFALALIGPNGMRDGTKIREEAGRIRAEVSELEIKKSDLARQTEMIRDDKRMIERAARDMGMVKPDETVIMLPQSIRHGN